LVSGLTPSQTLLTTETYPNHNGKENRGKGKERDVWRKLGLGFMSIWVVEIGLWVIELS
jgi:hypothetical protein